MMSGQSQTTASATAEGIVGYLKEAAGGTGYSPYEIYERALGLWGALLQGALEGEAWQKAISGLEAVQEPLAKAFAELLLASSEGYEDILGPLSVSLAGRDRRFPSNITPYPIAKMQAGLLLTDLSRPLPQEEPLAVYSPCCGSGALLLAAADVIAARFPEMIANNEVVFYGQDSHPLCVAMSQLNCLLHGLNRPGGKRDLMNLVNTVAQVSVPPQDALWIAPPTGDAS